MVKTAASGLLQMSEYRGSEGEAAPDFGGFGHGRRGLRWWFVEINGVECTGELRLENAPMGLS